MPSPALTPDQQAEAQRIYDVLLQAASSDLKQIAELLASKEDAQLLGQTEFEVRDHVHRLGAHAIQTALAERKKRGM